MQSLQRKINADTVEIKGEEAPKGGLQRKVNADTPKNKRWSQKINGEETVFYCGNVCVPSAQISSLHTIASSHHSHKHDIIHHIASMAQEGNTTLTFGNCFRWNYAKAQNKVWRSAVSSTLVSEEIYCLWSIIFSRIWIFFTKHEKKGRCFFSPKAQKRYVCKVSCIVKNWITYNLYITFKTIEYYTLCSANITSIFQMFLQQ